MLGLKDKGTFAKWLSIDNLCQDGYVYMKEKYFAEICNNLEVLVFRGITSSIVIQYLMTKIDRFSVHFMSQETLQILNRP